MADSTALNLDRPPSDKDEHAADAPLTGEILAPEATDAAEGQVLDLTIDDTADAGREPLDLGPLKQAMMQLQRGLSGGNSPAGDEPQIAEEVPAALAEDVVDRFHEETPATVIEAMPVPADEILQPEPQQSYDPIAEATLVRVAEETQPDPVAQTAIEPIEDVIRAPAAETETALFEPALFEPAVTEPAATDAAPAYIDIDIPETETAEAPSSTPAIPMPELLAPAAAAATAAAFATLPQPAAEPEPAPPEAVEEPLMPGRIGVLLVNLGTPEAPDAKSVRAYLREFLSDKRVIENDGFLWKLVFNWIVLPFRPRIKAKAYKKIWNTERNESPLKTITRAQAEKLGETMAGVDDGIIVDWAMRYGAPSIGSRLDAMLARGVERILLMPLYPQYSASTTATVNDAVFRKLMQMRKQPALRVLPPYYDDTVYIEALATSIEAHLAAVDVLPEVIVASYHGMPQDYVAKGDPYEAHCIETTRLLRERLGLDEDKLIMTFQSRFGRGKWLEPPTDKTLKKLAKKGVKSVAVVTPGFSADCLETLEEIAIENAHIFKKAGGEHFTFVPCLNDSEPGMTVLWQTALRELKGWV